ncbi:MAG: D-Ala-D-Ala carboxypeptidase family metallohydrolase [candidate division WOR-3 bacterium]
MQLAPALLLLVSAAVADSSWIAINGSSYDWSCIGRFVLPGETLRFRMVDSAGCGGWIAANGEIFITGPSQAEWVAPAEPGLYNLLAIGSTRTATINVFVMIPFDSLKDGWLRGIRFGRYPTGVSFAHLERPRGFVVVTPENETTRVSPHYSIGEFAVGQFEGYPKYIAIREGIVLKLELLTKMVAMKRHGNHKLRVISGFRTPARQRRGSAHRQSAHMYGAAVDIYVDADENHLMDDLNHDGDINCKDAQLLASYVDELESERPELTGGCGWYRRRASRGPFVHIDVRGERQRWHQ